MSDEKLSDEARAHYERYIRAMHAMRSGVAMLMQGPEQGGRETSPKHLRVGVNSSLVSTSALTRLLVEKGIITWEEYCKTLADEMEKEVRSYEAQLPKGVHLA